MSQMVNIIYLFIYPKVFQLMIIINLFNLNFKIMIETILFFIKHKN